MFQRSKNQNIINTREFFELKIYLLNTNFIFNSTAFLHLDFYTKYSIILLNSIFIIRPSLIMAVHNFLRFVAMIGQEPLSVL